MIFAPQGVNEFDIVKTIGNSLYSFTIKVYMYFSV